MSRRDTLTLAAAAAASAVTPASALTVSEADVAVIGCGAAGIAASRVLVRAGLSVLVIEGLGRLGGRCTTDALTFSAPFDRGAHWIHSADVNPLVKLGRDLGFDLYPDPLEERVFAPGAPATLIEDHSGFDAAVHAAEEALERQAARGEDGNALSHLPRDMGEWRGLAAFRLGPYDCGKTLSEISLLDFARATLGPDLFCRPGYGTILATLGRGLPTALSTVVNAITVDPDAVRIDTSRGPLRARAAIVTASTAVLASGAIKFTPILGGEVTRALEGLKLGSYLSIGFEIAPGAADLPGDTTVFVKSDDERNFAALARSGGGPVWYVGTGGIFARELEAAGEAATIAVASDWLASVFGAGIKDKIVRATTTPWGRMPLIGGAWSVASPGQSQSRAALREPHAQRVFFAGEACHDTLWGTVAGAWETGEAAARQAMDVVKG